MKGFSSLFCCGTCNFQDKEAKSEMDIVKLKSGNLKSLETKAFKNNKNLDLSNSDEFKSENSVVINKHEEKAEIMKDTLKNANANKKTEHPPEERKEIIKKNHGSKKSDKLSDNNSVGKDSNFTLGGAKNNSPEHGYFQNHTKISKEDAEKAKQLELEIIEGTHFEKGTKLLINALGLEISKRTDKDGIIYFGSEEIYSSNNNQINDFNSPYDKSGLGKRHFLIKYNVDDKEYYLKDANDGSGTFVKIDKKIAVRNCYIISFGETHFVINLGYEMVNKEPLATKMTIKILEGPKANQSFYFKSSDSPISIGRMEGCTIRFKSHTLSRIQCSLIFENKNWYIVDGDGMKFSTNGTWLFVEDYFKIFDQLLFKAGNSVFKIHHKSKD